MRFLFLQKSSVVTCQSNVSVAFPGSQWQLPHAALLSYSCKKDFKQMSHAEIARHERESTAQLGICIIFGLSLKTALERKDCEVYSNTVCTVCNGLVFMDFSVKIHGKVSIFGPTAVLTIFILTWQYCCCSVLTVSNSSKLRGLNFEPQLQHCSVCETLPLSKPQPHPNGICLKLWCFCFFSFPLVSYNSLLFLIMNVRCVNFYIAY